MHPMRPFWTPAVYDEALADVRASKVHESHYFEAKSLVEEGNRGAAKIGKALSAFSTDGGTLAIGVKESPNGIPDDLTPVPISGLPERVSQIAAACDPPVILPAMTVLPEAHGSEKGIVLVHIPASVDAPHQAPDNRFYGRDDRRSYPLVAAEVERILRLRQYRDSQITAQLTAYVERQLTDLGDTPWIAIVAVPAPIPANDQVLMQFMGNQYGLWLHTLLDQTNLLAGRGRPTRTATGVAIHADIDSYSRPNELLIHQLEIDRNATIRYATNDIAAAVSNVSTGLSRRDLQWRSMLAYVASLVELQNRIWDQAGAQYGMSIAVHLHGILGLHPENPYHNPIDGRVAQQDGFRPVAFQANTYERGTQLDAMAVRGELVDLHHRLFSPLFNSMGIPQVPDLPDYRRQV